jgi:hypothetical protein
MHVIQGEVLQVSHAFYFSLKRATVMKILINYLVKILVKIIECLVKK